MTLLLAALLSCRPEPAAPLAPGAVDPNLKSLRRARSADGRSWQVEPGVLASQASAPDLVVVDGRAWVYFVHRGERLARVPLDGGEVELLAVEVGRGLVVDPDLVALPEGGLRLYFVHQEQELDPGAQGRHNRILTATSADGRSFVVDPEPALEGAFVDPDVVPLPGGGWRMYLTEDAQRVRSARSDDGRRFTLEPGVRLQGGGVTCSLPTDAGGVRTWFHERWGIRRADSSDGLSFGPSALVLSGADLGPDLAAESPAVLERDGVAWMVLAQAPAGGAP